MRRRGGERGFVLIEMLALIVLLGAAAVLSMQVMRGSLGAARQIEQTHLARISYDAMITALRRDVWNAFEAAVGDERTLLLRHAQGRSTVWRIDVEGETVSRQEVTAEEAGAVRTFEAQGLSPRFAAAGPLVELHVQGVDGVMVQRFGSLLERIGGVR